MRDGVLIGLWLERWLLMGYGQGGGILTNTGRRDDVLTGHEQNRMYFE